MTDETTPRSGAEMLGTVKPTRRREAVQIVLNPEVLDEWHRLEAELEKSAREDAQSKRLAAGKRSKRTTELMAQLKDYTDGPVAEAAVWFRFEAMGKDDFRDLKLKHPPRADDRIDAMLGYNRQAVEDAMVRACLYDPVFEDCKRPAKDKCEHDDCGSWQQLVKIINPSEWGELEVACQKANRAVTELPKSHLLSAIRRLSDSASE